MSTDAVEVFTNPSVVATLAKAELDQSITTAKAYPRSIATFVRKVEGMALLNESVAEDCIYALPRRDSESGETKNIVGPSARFAEILLSSFGNCIAGATIVDDSGDYVVARGVFHDLENNSKVFREVRRRITGRNGRRYSADMIGVTANAAASIAQRNATFSGIPQAMWTAAFEKTLALVKGRAETFAARRDSAMDHLSKMGATADRVFSRLGITGVADLTVDHLVLLRGSVKAIQDGEAQLDEVFPPVKPVEQPEEKGKGTAALKAKVKAKVEPVADALKNSDGETVMCSVEGCTAQATLVIPEQGGFCAEHGPKGE
jgi:hypothetical protein